MRFAFLQEHLRFALEFLCSETLVSVLSAAGNVGIAIRNRVQNWVIFNVDTYLLRCYKPLKEKLFGGESPYRIAKSNPRVRPQTCLAGQAC